MKLLTKDAAEHLSKEMGSAIHAARFEDSFATVDQILKELEAKEKKVVAEPWLASISKLETRVADLEKEIEGLHKQVATQIAKPLTKSK